MGFDVLKFVLPASVLKIETELNLGFCKEIQRGVKNGFQTHKVPWDKCTKTVIDASDPEHKILDISDCKRHKGYDPSHDCTDGTLDISKCMEGKIIKDIYLSLFRRPIYPISQKFNQHETFGLSCLIFI